MTAICQHMRRSDQICDPCGRYPAEHCSPCAITQVPTLQQAVALARRQSSTDALIMIPAARFEALLHDKHFQACFDPIGTAAENRKGRAGLAYGCRIETDAYAGLEGARYPAEYVDFIVPLHPKPWTAAVKLVAEGVEQLEPNPPLTLDEIVAMIEEELPGWAWTLGKITNKTHTMPPRGEGFTCTVNGGERKVVAEKAKSLHGAALRAIGRGKQILADLENEI